MTNGIYTDLAYEARELHSSEAISGVTEQQESHDGYTVQRTEITSAEAAEALGKSAGKYIAIDAPELTSRPLDLFEAVADAVASELTSLLNGLAPDATVLIAGLGNRGITPDSLGPTVAERVFVTRHINSALPDALPAPVRSVCAFSPGVLGVTGIETLELIRGAVNHVKPDVLIVVDSLASRRAARISSTVQLTDTGISPGSGVNNARAGITNEELGTRVIAIGVPMVVNASTIAQDTMHLLAAESALPDEQKLLALVTKVMDEHIGPLVVAPKDIDVIIDDMAGILANGINRALFGDKFETVRALVA